MIASTHGSSTTTLAAARAKPIIDARQVLVGVRGSALTTFGGTRATWNALLERPEAIAHMAEEARLVKFARGSDGRETWSDPATQAELSVPEIEGRFGDLLRGQTGIRFLPDSTAAREVASGFGGLLPDYMRGDLLERTGLDRRSIKGTRFRNQTVFWNKSGFHSRMLTYAALESLAGLGQPLADLMQPRDFGISYGTAYHSHDAANELMEACARGVRGDELVKAVNHAFETLVTDVRTTLGDEVADQVIPIIDAIKAKATRVSGAKGGYELILGEMLANMAPAHVANLLAPEGEFRGENAAEVYRRIVGRPYDPALGARVLGSILVFVGACASGAGALHLARKQMTCLAPGEWGHVAMLVGAADTALEPLAFPYVLTGFGERAQATRAGIEARGWAPNQASRPFRADAPGMVNSEGVASTIVMSLYDAIRLRKPYQFIVLGTASSLGQGGKGHEGGVNHGIVNAFQNTFDQSREGHGIELADEEIVYFAHGTGTGPSNKEEPVALFTVMRSGRAAVTATKSHRGHDQGASSMIDLVLGGLALETGWVPGIRNFAPDGLEPALMSAEENGVGDVRTKLAFLDRASKIDPELVLVAGEGFGSINVVAAVKRADYENDGINYPGVPPEMHRAFLEAVTAGEMRRQSLDDQLRAGSLTRAQLAGQFGFTS